MTAIYNRLLKDKFGNFLAYTISGISLVLLYVMLVPSVQESQAQLSDFMKNLPAGLVKVFGLTSTSGTLENLLAMKQYNLIWPFMVIALAVSLAGSAVAGEIENRTIEIVLSSAKSRVKIFFGKYLAGLTYVLAFTVATTLCAIPLAKIFGYGYQAPNYYTLMYLSVAFSFAVYGISFLLSCLFSSRGKVAAVSGAIYVAMYVIFILVSIKESLQNLQYLSFFYYYNINDALLNNQLDHLGLVVFLVVGLIASAAALVAFMERDIAV